MSHIFERMSRFSSQNGLSFHASALETEPIAAPLNDTSHTSLNISLPGKNLFRASDAEEMVVPDPGDTPGTAYNVGTLTTTPITLTDSVGSFDLNDLYVFNLGFTANLNLALRGLSADADVQLFNANGTQLNISERSSNQDEAINHTLNAGVYYIRVYQFSGNTNYTLQLSATAASPFASPSNLLPTEVNVGTVGSTTQFLSGSVNSTDTADVYRFQVNNTSSFALSLTNLTADADVRLIRDANNNGIVDVGEEIARSQRGSNLDELINLFSLAAGSYFVQVYQYTGDTAYTLGLSATVNNLVDNAGNTLATARNIGALGATQTFSDYVGSNDTNDYYRFTLNTPSTFNLLLNNLSADADVQLIRDFNGNGLVDVGEVIAYPFQNGNLPESLSINLDPGAYFVRVFPYSGNTTYTLSLSATSTVNIPDGAGNTLQTARNIGLLNSSQTFNDYVGNTDTNDFYRFTLNNSSAFNLSLTGLSADADVQLLNSNGNLITSSIASGNSPESISRVLTAGTYYVRVYQYSGNTNYALNLSASTVNLPAGYDPFYGYGMVDAAAAVARAIGQPFAFPNVPNLGGNNWGNDLINAPEVWSQGITGQGIVVAVIDTGVDYTHADLDNNIWINTREIPNNGIDDDGNGYIDDVRGWDFFSNDNNPMDSNGHGTHVAGTIAAENNGFGATGVAFNARIMPIRVLGADGSGSNSAVAAGIRYAADNGAQVINLSLGGGFSQAVASAVEYASLRGAVVVMASGNEGENQPSFPARLANQYGIAVGAVNINQQVANFSNLAGVNPLNYVVAPGVDVYSTVPGNSYRYFDGTSMATPHVAGVAALMLSANNRLTPSQVVSLLTSTADPTGITV